MTYSETDLALIKERPVLIKCNSHRARYKLKNLLGESIGIEWFSFYRKGEFYRLTQKQALQAIEIPGIARARDTGNLQRCISFSGFYAI